MRTEEILPFFWISELRVASAITTASASSAFAVIRGLIFPVVYDYRCAENEMLKTFGIWLGSSNRTLPSFELENDVHINTRLAKVILLRLVYQIFTVPDPELWPAVRAKGVEIESNTISGNFHQNPWVGAKKKRIQIYCSPCWKTRDVIFIGNMGIQLVQMPMTTLFCACAWLLMQFTKPERWTSFTL